MTKDTKSTGAENADAALNGDSPLISKLKQHKSANDGSDSTTLPETGIEVTWPKFQSHGAWMKAQRLAKKDMSKASTFYITGVCKFEGEKLTTAEFIDLIPANDVIHLMSQVMGDDKDEDEEDGTVGNALH